MPGLDFSPGEKHPSNEESHPMVSFEVGMVVRREERSICLSLSFGHLGACWFFCLFFLETENCVAEDGFKLLPDPPSSAS